MYFRTIYEREGQDQNNGMHILSLQVPALRTWLLLLYIIESFPLIWPKIGQYSMLILKPLCCAVSSQTQLLILAWHFFFTWFKIIECFEGATIIWAIWCRGWRWWKCYWRWWKALCRRRVIITVVINMIPDGCTTLSTRTTWSFWNPVMDKINNSYYNIKS